MTPDDAEDLEEPADYPQQEREWRGGWLSVILPLALIGVVAAVVIGYFWLSTS